MATAAQIITLACQIAKVPGMTTQAGLLLNSALQDLCQNYDFDTARTTHTFNFDTTLGSGPYELPTDYLRCSYEDFFYTIQGVKYPLISVDLAEFDLMVQTAGLQSYPTFFATDMSPLAEQGAPLLYVWVPPSGAYPCTLRYFRQMPDIDDPASSATVPWFPNQQYLIKRVAANLMMIANDDRQAGMDEQARGELNEYLKMKDDKTNRAAHVRLDRRYFGNNFNRLPNTKVVGW